MKKQTLALLLIVYSNIVISQDLKIYIDSYDEYTNCGIIDCSLLEQSNQRVNESDAIKFVYYGDTSNINCTKIDIDMWTEENRGYVRERELPIKCLKITTDTYFLIAHTSLKCNAPNELTDYFMFFEIFNKEYKKIDSLLVVKGNEYENSISGLLNPEQQMIFVAGNIQSDKKMQAFIYRINTQTLRFEQIKENYEIDHVPDNLLPLLQTLDWEDCFNTGDCDN
ncbi:MAG: hypothetical protein MJ069_06450 [Salinivirgaceae bacterium]|nr:hypothetical protein [Salinivirgaceae bacterium]